MRQTVHLFFGDDLSPVCEAVARHSKSFGSKRQNEYTHFICCSKTKDSCSMRIIGSSNVKQQIVSDDDAIQYFDTLYNKTVTIAHPGVTTDLLITFYLCLYAEEDIAACLYLIEMIRKSSKPYELNIIGLTDDLAPIFCNTEGEKNELNSQSKRLKETTKCGVVKLLKSKQETSEFLRLFIFQNCAENGTSLDLDKNTLIRILGEYAIIVTESYFDLFPPSALPSKEITLMGMSSLWFNQMFFKNMLLKRTFCYLLEREKVDEKSMADPAILLRQANDIVEDNKDSLTSFVNNEVISNYKVGYTHVSTKDDVIKKFKDDLDRMSLSFEGILGIPALSLPEKRALIAILVGKDDPLLDDEMFLKKLPSLDDCMSASVDLFVRENNNMPSSVFDGPHKNGVLYNPIDELKQKRKELRLSHSSLSSFSKRLKDIENSLLLVDDSKKLLTEDGFTFGETTYKLQEDVVEKPLTETYQPKDTLSIRSINLTDMFSSIRDQGQIGACASFALSSIFEYIINTANGGEEKIQLSPRFLYYNVCEKNDDGTPNDKGSSFYDNIQSLREQGICEERLCQYSRNIAVAPEREAIEDAKSRLVTEAKNVNVCHKDITSALAEGFPVAISLKIFDSFGKGKKGFVFRPSEKELQSSDFGYHAMVICGFSEEKHIYIVRNSWGSQFGDKGYCYVPFSYIEDKNLCRNAIIITGVSCAQKNAEVDLRDRDIEIDCGDKDIEYSVLRIKKEEEKEHYKVLKQQYEGLYKDYIKLLEDLGNQSKVQQVINYAANNVVLPAGGDCQEGGMSGPVEKSANNSKTIGIVIAIISAVLCTVFCLLHSGIVLPIIFSLLVLVGIIMAFYQKKQERSSDTKPDDNSIPAFDEKVITELKLTLAGQQIRKIKELREDLMNQHRNLVSYTCILCKWLEEENTLLETSKERLRPPFISLISDDDFENYFEKEKSALTGDLWLYKEFQYYKLDKGDIVDFKNRLQSKLQASINNVYTKFSMYQYLTNLASYPYMLDAKEERITSWLNDIERMSLPFGHIHGEDTAALIKRIFVCLPNATDKDKSRWYSFLQQHYSLPPSTGQIESPLKLIYIQIDETSAKELNFMQ